MPCGKRCGSTTMLALASRLTCQQSSMLTYTYPASFIPDETTASAMLLIMSSLTLHANLFQEFHPMGGVSARLAEMEGLSCAARKAAERERPTISRGMRRRIFMQTLYQNDRKIETAMVGAGFSLASYFLVEEIGHELDGFFCLRQLEVIPEGVWERLEDSQLRVDTGAEQRAVEN